MLYITAPIIRFEPVEGSFPARWEARDYPAKLYAFGFLPLGQQTIGIEYPPIEGDCRTLRDNGRGQLIKRWDHWLLVEPEDGGTRYTDRVDIEAGILTPFIALYAQMFFAHRQRRWRKLINSKFSELEA